MERELNDANVVVTGIGTIGSFGAGGDALSAALESATLVTSQIDRSQGFHRSRGATAAALVDDAILREWVHPRLARRMSRPSRLAVAAARMASSAAGFGDAATSRAGVFLATVFGSISPTEGMLRSLVDDGPLTVSPFHFTECVANAPSAQVAIQCRANGPNLTITQREAGPLIAVAQGCRTLRAGRADRAFVGAVDEMPPILHAILDRFAALTRSDAAGHEKPMPLDLRRDGVLAAEGATVLALECEAGALARGVTPLARVVGFGAAFDPTAPACAWGRGETVLARHLRRGLDAAGIRLDSIDRIVAGASGCVGGDRLEARLLVELWGSAGLPPVLAPKGIVGEYAGGFLGSVVLAVRGGSWATPPGFRKPDPALGVIPARAEQMAPGRILATSVAAGGAAAWLVLETA